MTRERLWKRLLYGTQLVTTGDRSKKVNNALTLLLNPCELSLKLGLERLSCSEFCSLLSLVKVCPLDTLDSRLSVFNKMSRAWYTNLIRYSLSHTFVSMY